MALESFGPKGVFVYSPKKNCDRRGEFTELYNWGTLQNLRIDGFIQQNIVKSKFCVIRGMHWQESPFEQAKLITVLQGEIQDVIIDLREDSETFNQIFSLKLGSESTDSIFIPSGFAHGYQALKHNTLISYSVTNQYAPQYERRINPLSERFRIYWKEPFLIGEQDANSEFE